MSRRLGAALVLLLPLLLFTLAARADQRAELPGCIHVAAFARYGAYGYDHIVTIDNACESGAECIVSTNVNPSSINVRVEAGSRESVLTYRGSPASQFAARVRCSLD